MATPALAQPAGLEMFLPEGNFEDKDVLSDAFDGTDEFARLTAVGAEDVEFVEWFFCELGSTQDDLDSNDCESVGRDSTGIDPSAGEDPDDDSENELAFEVLVDIGDTTFEDEDAEVFAIGCEDEPDFDDIEDNCYVDEENDIFLDDGEGTGGQDIPTGHIVGVCHPDKVKDEGSAKSYTWGTEDCDTADEFVAVEHGDLVSGDGFMVLFTTSGDVTGSGGSDRPEDAVGACVDFGTDWDTEPSGCDADDDDQVTETADSSGSSHEYIAMIDGEHLDSIPAPEDDSSNGEAEVDLAIYGRSEDSSNGECDSTAGFAQSDDADTEVFGTDICVFEEIYLQTQEEMAGAVSATFDPTGERQPSFGNDPGDPSPVSEMHPAVGDVCDSPDTTEDNELGDVERVVGCLSNQWGQAWTGTALTFVSTGVGGIDPDSCEGTSDDTDGDGDIDLCTEDTADLEYESDNGADIDDEHPSGTADVTGTATIELINDDSPGQQTITVCADEDVEADADNATDNAGAGCEADEVTSAPLTKNWGTDAVRVDLVFEDDASNGCASSQEFRQNVVNDFDQLVVCTTDAAGNPASSDSVNADLEWQVEDPNVATFSDTANNPPGETGADGKATAQIQARSQGSTDITVCLDFAGAEQDSCDTVTKTVSGDGPPPPPPGRPECNDGVDNDGDGTVDSADADCANAQDTSESSSGQPLPLCNNNADDDGDGRTDEQDPGCSGPNDNSESPDPQPPARSNTNTTIRYDESVGAFKGSVGSNRKACSRFRKVVLKKAVPGPNRTVGTDRSNRAGNWKVRKPRANGNFYAVAKRKRFTNRFGRVIICLRDKSPTINV